MKFSPVVIVLVSASAMAACRSPEPTNPVTSSFADVGMCTAFVNGQRFLAPVSYRLGAVHVAGGQPSSFWISCQHSPDDAELIAFAPYPPRVGTTVYPTDSLSVMSGGYVSPGGVNYLTWGAGASGSITITAWDSTTGAVSGRFSFTANPLGPYTGGPPPTSTPVVASGSFMDAQIAP